MSIAFLLIILIICIGSVSANDDIDNDSLYLDSNGSSINSNYDDIKVDYTVVSSGDSVDNQMLKASEEDSVVLGTENKELNNDLLDNENGDNIVLNKDYDSEFAGNNYTTGMDRNSTIVSKSTLTINVDVDDITYGDNATVNVNVVGVNGIGLNGTVTVNIAGKDYLVNVTDGVGNLIIGLNVGYYEVLTVFAGNNNYNATENNTAFNVYKSGIRIGVNTKSRNIVYGDDAVAYISLKGSYNGELFSGIGNATVKLNSETIVGVYNYTVTDGFGTLVIPGLDAGKYQVIIFYPGNENYRDAYNGFVSYTVYKANVNEFVVSVNDTVYGDDTKIDIKLIGIENQGLNGTVNVNIAGKDYLVNVTDGVGNLTVHIDNAGKYELVASFDGNENYNGANYNTSFKVSSDIFFYVDFNDIIYGENATVNVNVVDINGNNLNGVVRTTINGKDYSANVTNGVGSLIIPGLNVGNYSFVVTYTNMNYTLSDTAEVNVNVGKANVTEFIVSVNNSTYGENNTVSIRLIGVNGEALNGTVTVTIKDKNKVNKNYLVNVTDGRGSIFVPVYAAGEYNDVVATYKGNDNYNASKNMTSFKVSKATPSIKVDVPEVTYGEDATLNINVLGVNDEALNGTVTVTVNGKEYNITVTDGKGSLTVPGLNAGNYSFVVNYLGNENYTVVSTTGQVKVGKANVTEFSLKQQIFIYTHVELSLNFNVVGVNGEALNADIFTVNVDGKNYTGDVFNGIGQVWILCPAVGEYELVVSFAGNENYNAIENKTLLTIIKYKSNFYLNIDDVSYGNDVNIIILEQSGNIPNGDHIIVTITGISSSVKDKSVLGRNYTVTFSVGVGSVLVPGLDVGEYTFTAIYEGNENCTGFIGTGSAEVYKANVTEFVVSVDDNTYGEDVKVNVKLIGVNDEALNGTVTVTVNGKDYTVPVTNGRGSVLVPGLDIGEYDLVANFTGNDNYNATENKILFNVSKATPSIKVDVPEVNYGEDATLNINVFCVNDTGLNGIVTVNGKEYNITVTDGKGSLTVPGLDAGDYSFVINFPGNENYTLVSTTGQFTVGKANVTVFIVSEGNINYGQNNTVNIRIIGVNGEALTGIVTVTVDGKDYDVNVVDVAGSLTIDGLAAGDYELVASFAGNDNYNAGENKTSFKVNKAISEIRLTIDNITYGNDLVININLTGVNDTGLNGTVTIIMYGFNNYTVTVTDGKCKLNVPGINASYYGFGVVFDGNENYTEALDNERVDVFKANVTEFVVSVDDTTYGKDAEINIKLIGVNGEALNDTVTFTVDGNDYTVPVTNGHGSLDIPGLSSGKYDVLTNFAGDNNYNASENRTSFNVGKVDPVLDVNLVDVDFNGKNFIAKFNVSLTGVNDEALNDTIIVTVDGNDYNVTIINDTGNLIVTDLFANEYTVDSIFNGIKNYNPTESLFNFTIDHLKPNLNVSSSVKDDSVNITIKLTGVNGTGLNGTVVVYVNNKRYDVAVVDGIDYLVLDNLKNGQYDLNLVFDGDEIYSGIEANISFIIDYASSNNTDSNGINSNNTNNINNNVNSNGINSVAVYGYDSSLVGNGDSSVSDLPKTGNPILVLLFVLSLIGIVVSRKK
ncbi:hypothetical protein BGI41_02065 [Methanobrevibacter sp. 87.7]|nr:hypothetical protein BGI41_02065 [Methanobrevibacter sp. 87.7]